MLLVYRDYLKNLNLEPNVGEDPIKANFVNQREVNDFPYNKVFADNGITTSLLLYAFSARFGLWTYLLMAYPAIYIFHKVLIASTILHKYGLVR